MQRKRLESGKKLIIELLLFNMKYRYVGCSSPHFLPPSKKKKRSRLRLFSTNWGKCQWIWEVNCVIIMQKEHIPEHCFHMNSLLLCACSRTSHYVYVACLIVKSTYTCVSCWVHSSSLVERYWDEILSRSLANTYWHYQPKWQRYGYQYPFTGQFGTVCCFGDTL